MRKNDSAVTIRGALFISEFRLNISKESKRRLLKCDIPYILTQICRLSYTNDKDSKKYFFLYLIGYTLSVKRLNRITVGLEKIKWPL